jgi:hypothetical protein
MIIARHFLETSFEKITCFFWDRHRAFGMQLSAQLCIRHRWKAPQADCISLNKIAF